MEEGSLHAQTQLCNFLVRWLQQISEDFLEKQERDSLDSFITIIVQEPMVRVLQRLLVKLVPDFGGDGESSLASRVPGSLSSTLDPLDFSPTAVADAMTLAEHRLFSKIKLQEFIGQGWSKPNKAELCPGITEAVASFNKWSVYVAANIINHREKDTRTKRFAFWVEVHKQLFNLNNMELATAVGAAFELTPLFKLRNRGMIDVKGSLKKWLTYFAGLQKNNKAGYRKLIRKIMAESDPGIPYIGGHLSDLTFMEDGNKSEVDGLINVRKYHMIAKQVRIIDQLQKRKYAGLSPPAELEQFCRDMKAPPVSVVDEISDKLIAAAASPSTDTGTPKSALFTPAAEVTSPISPAMAPKAPPRRPISVLSAGASLESAEAAAVEDLLEKEASCAAADRAARWSKWKERYDRQGETFVKVFCSSRAWRITVESILHEPVLASEEIRNLRDVADAFLLPESQPGSVVNILLSIGTTEPEEAVISMVAAITDGLKRFTFDLPALKPADVLPRPGDVEAIKGTLKLVSLASTPMSRAHFDMQACIGAFGQVPEIRELLGSPIEDHETEMARLESERESVLSRMNREKEERVNQLDQHRKQIQEIAAKEVELRAELARLGAKREELEDTWERLAEVVLHEESNLSKKIEILDTSIIDESQGVKYLNLALESFSSYAEQTGPGVVRTLQERFDLVTLTLSHRMDMVLNLLDWFKESFVNTPGPELTAAWKSFDATVYLPIVVDVVEKDLREQLEAKYADVAPK